eukprot:76039-Pyramimonas_sp.AAC.1
MVRALTGWAGDAMDIPPGTRHVSVDVGAVYELFGHRHVVAQPAVSRSTSAGSSRQPASVTGARRGEDDSRPHCQQRRQ